MTGVLSALFLFIWFVILFGKGFERFVQGRSLIGSAATMLLGLLAGATCVWLLIASIFGHSIWFLSEYASASLGFGASAPCYGGTENVRIVPVVIPEFELCDIQRHSGCNRPYRSDFQSIA